MKTQTLSTCLSGFPLQWCYFPQEIKSVVVLWSWLWSLRAVCFHSQMYYLCLRLLLLRLAMFMWVLISFMMSASEIRKSGVLYFWNWEAFKTCLFLYWFVSVLTTIVVLQYVIWQLKKRVLMVFHHHFIAESLIAFLISVVIR